MGFFKKLFSSPLKLAHAAEAQGQLSEALRLYAEAGAWPEVLRVQVARARLEADPAARLEVLRGAVVTATRLPPSEAEALRQTRSELASELLSQARAHTSRTDFDRRLLEEVVQVGTAGANFAAVGEALERLGRREEAAQAFAHAGLIDRMEALYQTLASERGHANQLQDAFSAYELGLKTGDRLAALESIRRCQTLAPQERRYGELRDSLEAGLLSDGIIPLRVDGRRVCLTGRIPADIGREVGCRVLLREPSVSRAHARIGREAGSWFVRDLQSRNGTFLSGLRVASSLPLRERGSLRLGEYATFDFVEEKGALLLTGTQGLDRGSEFWLFEGEFSSEALLAGVRFGYHGEFAAAEPAPGERFLLNGQACAVRVLLLDGDELQAGGRMVRVRRALTEG
jgi:pSer/pThr/pTyr-binding forkhead associated (FHA) protein